MSPSRINTLARLAGILNLMLKLTAHISLNYNNNVK
jgi:hypothetical protein